jgi:arylsulfatase A-like enzyme
MIDSGRHEMLSGNRFSAAVMIASLALAAALTAGSAGASAAGARATEQRKPNIVLIVADDLGYGELGVQGCKDILTPHIDGIARRGVRFTSGYASCPVCSPTRAGLLTGRYQQRFGHEFNPPNEEASDPNFGLPLTETTLAERLKKLGYATGMVGKWHLGFRPDLQPTRRGFDEFFGFLGGAHNYFSPDRGAIPILRGTIRIQEHDYLTDAFAREAVHFINRHKGEPFFLYLPFNAVHAPLQATEHYLERFRSIEDPKRRTFAAMLAAQDDAVGRVLAAIRDAALENDTLIIFLSDNGGPTHQTSSSNLPLRGYKAQVLEGGIRVPFLMQWSGRLPMGIEYALPVITLDIHPTVVAAAGGTIPVESRLDGVDLLPFLTGAKSGAPHDRLCWRFGRQGAVRMGDWKLVLLAQREPQLYNLAQDIGESHNLARHRPEKLKLLEAAYQAWNAELAEPRWPQGGREPPQVKKGASR